MTGRDAGTTGLGPDEVVGAGAATVPELLAQAAAAFPDNVACIETDVDGTPSRQLTYREWESRSARLAARLARTGVRAGDVVALLLPSNAEYLVCYHALMRLGAITSGINLRLGRDAIDGILDELAPRLVIAESGASVTAGHQVLEQAALTDLADEDEHGIAPITPETTTAVVWTSGSTGRPKGAVFDHGNQRALSIASYGYVGAFDRYNASLPFPHVGTMTRQWEHIARVITATITPTPWRVDSAVRAMSATGITVGLGVPTQWELILRHLDGSPDGLDQMRVICTGGSRVPADLITRLRERFGVPILIRYSSTEASVIAQTHPDDPDAVVLETVGRPAPGVELRIVDDAGEPVPDGAVGRIQVRSAAMMREYWRYPELTAATLADGWLTAGDEGQRREDGRLCVSGRRGEIYIRGGYNVYPAEVETVLRQHPAVSEAAVVPLPDPVLGEIGHAFVIVTAPVELDDVRRWITERLADFKAPDRLTVLDAFPLTPMLKIDRTELRRRASDDDLDGPSGSG